jgi:hypothetical protein
MRSGWDERDERPAPGEIFRGVDRGHVGYVLRVR